MTTEVLADSFNTESKIISNNFNRNIERFIEGKHYFRLEGDSLREFKGIHQYDDSLKYVSILYLWTDRGTARHAKILDTDEAWEVYEQLEENYFNPRENKPVCLEDVLIQSLQEMKAVKLQINAVNEKVIQVDKKAETVQNDLQSMRDVYTLSPNAWRMDTSKLISAIALKLGGFDHIKQVREESYRILDERAGARLGIRLANMRKNVLVETGSRAKSEKVTKVDVISADKRLVEVYCLIVKEMAIKYKAA